MRRRPRKILIVDGHPDPAMGRLVHALSSAYGAAAEGAGHEVRTTTLALLDVAPLRTRADWEEGGVPEAITTLQYDLLWADHLVLLFPLWLGDLPSRVKALLEQLLRPGFAFVERHGRFHARLRRRSARLVITMGMPSFVYRLWFGAPVVKLLRRGIFGLVGIRPVRATLFGGIEGDGAAERALRRVTRLGRRGR